MPIQITKEPIKRLQAGINKLADTVALTLGPNGKNVLIDMGGDRAPLSTRDGVTVANFVNLPDKIENFDAQLIKQAARDTNNDAGDGTTTATVLARAIFNEGLKYTKKNYPIDIKRSIENAVDKAITKLKDLSIPVKDQELVDVASISANNDRELGSKIAEAFIKVGKNGAVLVEHSPSSETYVSYQEGMIIERGWKETSMYFVTNFQKRNIEFLNPKILVVYDKIYTYEVLEPVLKHIAKTKENLIIIVNEIEDSVLGWLVANKLKGLPIAVIHTPGFNNPELIDDLCVRIGGRYYDPYVRHISNFQPDDLGSAKRVIIGEIDTTIVEGSGDATQRLAELSAQAEKETDQVKKGRYLDRINRLKNSVATLHISADSETEMKDKKLRIEDAINATKSAMEEGIVFGGGTEFLKIKSKGNTIGEKILNVALEAPIRQIVENTGDNANIVLNSLEFYYNLGDDKMGYDAKTKKLCQLDSCGIYNPVKVSRTALQKAGSIASMLLITGHSISAEK